MRMATHLTRAQLPPGKYEALIRQKTKQTATMCLTTFGCGGTRYSPWRAAWRMYALLSTLAPHPAHPTRDNPTQHPVHPQPNKPQTPPPQLAGSRRCSMDALQSILASVGEFHSKAGGSASNVGRALATGFGVQVQLVSFLLSFH